MHTSLFLFLGDIGGSELILIMVVILVFFGANKIPELARGLGKGIKEFKDASTEIRKEFETAGQSPQQPYTSPLPLDAHPSQAQHPAPYLGVSASDGVHHPAASPTDAVAENTPFVAPALPPNLAPEGTQPRQPYVPAAPDA